MIDQFQFSESTCALLEFFVDQKRVIHNGIPEDYSHDLRLILIMNEYDAEKCYERKVFIEKFTYVPLKIPTKEELRIIMEQLLTIHLQSQNFSSDYISVTAGISNSTMKLLSTIGIQHKKWLPSVIRIVKGIMFSSPDNSPDIDSIIRLFLHEVIRVLSDRTLKKKSKITFFSVSNYT